MHIHRREVLPESADDFRNQAGNHTFPAALPPALWVREKRPPFLSFSAAAAEVVRPLPCAVNCRGKRQYSFFFSARYIIQAQ